MRRTTSILVAGLIVSALILGGTFLYMNLGALSWFIPDNDPPRDHGIACVDSDPSRYSNVTYVQFDSLDEQEQELLKPALEEGHVALTAEQAHSVNHTFIEYRNETYRCGGGIP